MAEQPDQTQLLQQLLQQLQQSQPAPAAWPSAAGATAAPFAGVAVPVKIATPGGECRCYLQFGAEVAQGGPAALINAMQLVMAQGFQIDTFQSRGGWNGGGRGGWNGRGGYGGGRW